MFCSRKRMLKLEKRWENGASQKERVFLLSLISLRHNKDGSYKSTNINKQLSPAQNTPLLQATPKLDVFSSNGVEFIELAKCAIFSTSCDCAIWEARARTFDEDAAQRMKKQNGVGNYLRKRWINSISVIITCGSEFEARPWEEPFCQDLICRLWMWFCLW